MAGTYAVPIDTAAEALGVSKTTLRRWVAAGAPVAHRGGRGRGRSTLVDIAAVQAWRRQGEDARADLARVLACEMSELVGEAVSEAFRLAPDKRDARGAAWVACAAWQHVVSALMDRLRMENAELPDVETVPESMERLRKIATR